MRRLGALLAVLMLAALPAARAEPPAPPVALHLTYVTYASGFTTVRLAATVELTAEGYRLSIDYHTVGMIGFLFPGRDVAAAEGTWQAGAAAPEDFQSDGAWSGRPFDVAISYRGGTPEVRRLEPSQAAKRESVPASLRQNTIDTLSAMALLFQRMAGGEGCRMALNVFDGRRLMTLDAEPAGIEQLGPTTRSFFHGPAARCDVSGRMLAGFLRSDGPAERERVQRGAAWFAHPIPGLPLLPVRIAFTTHWFGTATMYLTDIQAAPPAGGKMAWVAVTPATIGSQVEPATH